MTVHEKNWRFTSLVTTQKMNLLLLKGLNNQGSVNWPLSWCK